MGEDADSSREFHQLEARESLLHVCSFYFLEADGFASAAWPARLPHAIEEGQMSPKCQENLEAWV